MVLLISGCKHNTKQTVDISSYQYVGRDKCIDCHKDQYELFKGSHHDMAMDIATDETVLGDFNNTTFTNFGVTSKFYKKGDDFYVYTEGTDGEMKEFKIDYTFGYYPLQQYLIKFPHNGYQCLPLSWDCRPKEEGGQRWFHLYPDEPIRHDDILYWTSRTQTWNFMCAECHSTNLKKNYNLDSMTYNTTWTEIDVSCEACHGPGSEHVKWAEADELGEPTDQWKDMGMAILLADTNTFPWKINDSTGNAERTVPLAHDKTIEMCARCHTRRSQLTEEYTYGGSILNTHDIQLLDHIHYFYDGQILDEDYVYGSFVQSKMYMQGVRCVDCHDPHSGERIAEGDDLCLRCHSPEKFASRDHHFHDPKQEGARCIECHMVDRNYMVVDPRNDHSFRIPRPDLTEKIGVPNACNDCHDDKSTKWAVESFKKWWDLGKYPKHYGITIAEASKGMPSSRSELIAIAHDTTHAPIIRSTAIYYLQMFPGQDVASALCPLLKNTDPLIRATTVATLSFVPLDQLSRHLLPLLKDNVKLVRMRVAHALLQIDKTKLNDEQLTLLKKVTDEYIEVQYTNSDVTAGLLNLGVYHYYNGNYNASEMFYNKAIETHPAFDGSYINLADLYRNQNREKEGIEVLQKGLKKASYSADIHHAMGLAKIRSNKKQESLGYLQEASKIAPQNSRYQYVYAIALNSLGKPKEAIKTLEDALKESPYDTDVLYTLVTLNIEQNDKTKALFYANKLTEYYPNNQNFKTLLQQIK